MSEKNYEREIEKGLILWLSEVRGIEAVEASIEESEGERGWIDGCDTCGYGAEGGTIETPIFWKGEGDRFWNRVTIKGTSVNFLPELLGYIDRANA